MKGFELGRPEDEVVEEATEEVAEEVATEE